MDPFTLGTIGLGLLNSLPKIGAGLSQQRQADKLKLQSTETPEEREQLAMSRQAAATSRLPGMGQMQTRLGMGQAAALQNARLGAASGADYLAAAGAADARRQAGEADLAAKGLAYLDQSKQQLRRDLNMASQRRQRDLDTYNTQKAALTQAGAQNISAGIDSLSSYGAQALQMGVQNKVDKAQAIDAEIGAEELEPIKIGLNRTLPGLPSTLPNLAGYTPGRSVGLRRPQYGLGTGSQYLKLGMGGNW